MTAVVSLFSSYISSSNFPPLPMRQIGIEWMTCERRVSAQGDPGVTVLKFKVKKPSKNIKFNQVLGPINPAEQNEIDIIYTDLDPTTFKLQGLQDFEHRGHMLATDVLAGSKHLTLTTQQYIISGTNIIIDGYLYKVAAVERGGKIKLTTRTAIDMVRDTKVFVVRLFDIPSEKYHFDMSVRRLIIKDRSYSPFIGIYSAEYQHPYADLYQTLMNISLVPEGFPLEPSDVEVPGVLDQLGLEGVNDFMDFGQFVSLGSGEEFEVQLPVTANGERCLLSVICRDTESNFSVAAACFIDVLPALPSAPEVARTGTYAYPVISLPDAALYGRACRGFNVFRSTTEDAGSEDLVLLTAAPALDTFKDGPGDLNRVKSSEIGYPSKNKEYYYLIAPAMVSDVWDGDLMPAWQLHPEKGILNHKALPVVDEE